MKREIFSFSIYGIWHNIPISKRNKKYWYKFMDYPGWIYSAIIP